jgi:predicted NAD/FAD-dependent oxidoreductase
VASPRWLIHGPGGSVLTVDKGKGVGMATGRVGETLFDHGAQFVTAGDLGLAASVA